MSAHPNTRRHPLDGWLDDLLDDPVVVVGAMRSGTTLVARVLDSHPDVVYLGFELCEQWSDWTGLPWGAPGSDDLTCPPLSVDDATAERTDAVRAGLARRVEDHAEKTGRRPRAIVLKNPHLWHRLPFLRTTFPGARIVITSRPLLPSVASLRRLWRRSLHQHGRVHHLPRATDRCWDYVPAADGDGYDASRTFPGGDIEVLATFWHRVDRCLAAFHGAGQAVALVEHETLVREFPAVTRDLCRALDLPAWPLVPAEPLDVDRLQEWRSLLRPDEQRAIRAVPRELVSGG